VHDAAVPLVDRVVADGLAVEVVGDGEHLQAVLLQQRPAVGDVGVVVAARSTSRWSPQQAISRPS
jgi:hypothetical protein